MNAQNRQPDGNEIAAKYDSQICWYLTTFGYLTSRMIAALIRGADEPDDVRAAQRRLRSLTTRRLVSHERLDNGVPVYKLTQRGALYLKDLGYGGIPQRGTRDARTGNYFHRALSNNYLIFHANNFILYWPEYSVLKGRAPFKHMPFEGGKLIPDAVALKPDDSATNEGPSLVWIEAENAAKQAARLRKIARLADHILDPEFPDDGVADAHGHQIRHFLFICPNEARARAVVRAFARLLTYSEIIEGTRILIAPMNRSLIWPYSDDCWSGTVYDLGVELGLIEPPADFHQGSTADKNDERDSDEILFDMFGKEYEREFGEDFGHATPEAMRVFETRVLAVHEARPVLLIKETYWRDYEPDFRSGWEDDDDIVEDHPELI